MNRILNSTARALLMIRQIDLVAPRLEMLAGADTEKLLLAWILYALGWSALGVMSEIGVTLLGFLMRRSATTVPVAIASCLSPVREENQAVIGWVAWAFLAGTVVRFGLGAGVKRMYLWYAYRGGGVEISVGSCWMQVTGCQFGPEENSDGIVARRSVLKGGCCRNIG
jgi:hypothetical protein